MPPYDWWEPPARHGRVPDRRTDAGTFLTAEAFGCARVIYAKDQDGLYDCDPAIHPDASLITTITARDLIARGLDTLPLEPIVLEMLTDARLVAQIHLVNGLTPGAITKAVQGEPVGTVITAR
jgi:molybdenum storage protein